MIKKLTGKWGAGKASQKMDWQEENKALVALIRDGKAGEALEAGQKLMDYVDRQHPKDAPEKATTYNNVGMALMMHQDWDLAEECFREALAMRQRLFGQDNREVALVFMNLSQLYKIRAQLILSQHHENA